MKKIFYLIVVMAFANHMAIASEIDFDKIALTPYVNSVTGQTGNANKLLLNKLNQAVLKCGLAGQGIDDRFIITANANEIECVPTSTTPVRYALKIMLTIYVGDGVDGLLYSSYAVELKGIGNSLDDAYLSAYRKLNVNDPVLLQSIDTGRQRIINYYNERSSQIIANAQSLAASGDYDQAVYQLFLIPPMCNGYESAQNYAKSFATIACDKSNERIISNARAAWSASPNEEGAAEAQSILSQISNPSDKIITKSNALSKEIATRMQRVEDKRIALEQEEEKNRHKEAMANINANASIEKSRINAARDIAVSYYRSRPKVVYHVHWW